MQIFNKWSYRAQDLRDIPIIAHRGGASIGPENTLAAFRKGIGAGADMIESDIHLTKDNRIVVCHDHRIDRTTNGKGCIKDLTLDEIRQYRAKDADGNLTDERVPTLDEVMELMMATRAEGNPCGLLVEIKRTGDIYPGLEELLLRKIEECDAKGWVTVQSFDDYAIETMHRLDPSVRVEKLFFFKFPCLPLTLGWFTIDYFSYEKYDYVSSFNMHYLWLTKSLLNDIHRRGKEVKVWTLEGLNVPRMDVDGIITNRPDLWCEEKHREE